MVPNNIITENKTGIFEINKFYNNSQLNDIIKRKFPNKSA